MPEECCTRYSVEFSGVFLEQRERDVRREMHGILWLERAWELERRRVLVGQRERRNKK